MAGDKEEEIIVHIEKKQEIKKENKRKKDEDKKEDKKEEKEEKKDDEREDSDDNQSEEKEKKDDDSDKRKDEKNDNKDLEEKNSESKNPESEANPETTPGEEFGESTGGESGTAGAEGSTAGAEGGAAGTESGIAGTESGIAGTEGGIAGAEGGIAGAEGGIAGVEGGVAGVEGGVAGVEGGAAAGTAGAGAAGAGAGAGGAAAGAGGAAAGAGGAAAGAGGGIAAGGWIVILVIVVIVLILLIGNAIEDAIVDNDIELTTNGKMQLIHVVEDGSDPNVTGDKEQLEVAGKMSEKYASYIGYTKSQISYLYNYSVDENDTDTSGIGTNSAIINKLYSTNFGNNTFNTTGLVDVNDKAPLFMHIMNTEKYNFNKIQWKVYGHNNTEGRDMRDDEMKIDTDLGVKYPKDSTMTAEKFFSMTTPYMLSSAIPRGFAVTEASSNNSKNFASEIPDNDQYLFQMQGGDIFDYDGSIGKSEASLAYQIIKYGLSDITMDKYELTSYSLNTHYLKYIPTEKNDTFTVEVKYTENPLIQGPTQTFGIDRGLTSNISSTYGFNTHTINVGEEVDTSEGDPKKEDYDGHNYLYENVYYISYAKAFDIIKTFNYNFTPYSETDVNERLRADVETPVTSDYFEVDNESHKFNPENVLEGCSSVNDLINKYGCSYRQIGEKTSTTNQQTGEITYTVKYEITGANYTEKKGNRIDVNRIWKDKVNSGGSNSKNFDKEQLFEFNENKEADEGKETIAQSVLSNSDDMTYYSDLIEKKELNIIDILDSNPRVYRNYISPAQAVSRYIGMGRGSGNYYSTQGYRNAKKYLDQIATDNKLPFVYGGSMGYDVQTPGGSGSFMSGMELLRQFISHWEGHEGLADENMNPTTDESNAKYYKVDDIGDGVLTVGHGVNINAHMSQVKEATGQESFYVGQYLEKAAIDKVQIQIIETFVEKVRAEMSGLDLKEYQIHALTDRCYVKGNVNGSANAYRSYWNEATDDKYEELYKQYKDNQGATGEITSKIDFENAFFKNHMDIYVSSTFDAKWPGYEPRQKSEFILFQGGYYSPMAKFWTPSLSPGDINLYNPDGTVNEEKCIELQSWFEENIFGNNFHKAQTLDWAAISFTQYNSTYVSYVTHDEFKLQYYSGNTPCGKHGFIYQCPWWAISRASLYLEAVAPDKWPDGLPGGLGDGRQVAGNISSRYNVPLNTDPSQIKPNSIISYVNGGGWGHVAYVEAVDYVNKVYYQSHCGGGEGWYGITRKPLGVATVGKETFVGSVCMDDLI